MDISLVTTNGRISILWLRLSTLDTKKPLLINILERCYRYLWRGFIRISLASNIAIMVPGIYCILVLTALNPSCGLRLAACYS
jgi:hypothetical protein